MGLVGLDRVYINHGKNAQTFVQVDIIITKEYLQFVLWGTIVLELHSQLFALLSLVSSGLLCPISVQTFFRSK